MSNSSEFFSWLKIWFTLWGVFPPFQIEELYILLHYYYVYPIALLIGPRSRQASECGVLAGYLTAEKGIQTQNRSASAKEWYILWNCLQLGKDPALTFKTISRNWFPCSFHSSATTDLATSPLHAAFLIWYFPKCFPPSLSVVLTWGLDDTGNTTEQKEEHSLKESHLLPTSQISLPCHVAPSRTDAGSLNRDLLATNFTCSRTFLIQSSLSYMIRTSETLPFLSCLLSNPSTACCTSFNIEYRWILFVWEKNTYFVIGNAEMLSLNHLFISSEQEKSL